MIASDESSDGREKLAKRTEAVRLADEAVRLAYEARKLACEALRLECEARFGFKAGSMIEPRTIACLSGATIVFSEGTLDLRGPLSVEADRGTMVLDTEDAPCDAADRAERDEPDYTGDSRPCGRQRRRKRRGKPAAASPDGEALPADRGSDDAGAAHEKIP
jgi:hypothetical protein